MPPVPAADASTAELDAFHEALDARANEIHAERYPEGCGDASGHHCQRCLARLGQEPHTFRAIVTGARPGYKGRVTGHVCETCGRRS